MMQRSANTPDFRGFPEGYLPNINPSPSTMDCREHFSAQHCRVLFFVGQVAAAVHGVAPASLHGVLLAVGSTTNAHCSEEQGFNLFFAALRCEAAQ